MTTPQNVCLTVGSGFILHTDETTISSPSVFFPRKFKTSLKHGDGVKQKSVQSILEKLDSSGRHVSSPHFGDPADPGGSQNRDCYYAAEHDDRLYRVRPNDGFEATLDGEISSSEIFFNCTNAKHQKNTLCR